MEKFFPCTIETYICYSTIDQRKTVFGTHYRLKMQNGILLLFFAAKLIYNSFNNLEIGEEILSHCGYFVENIFH